MSQKVVEQSSCSCECDHRFSCHFTSSSNSRKQRYNKYPEPYIYLYLYTSYHVHGVTMSIPGLTMYCIVQLQYQCERMCGYVLMHEAHQLARCVAGRRLADANNLLLSTCSVVTTAVLRRGDRLRLQDVDPTDPSNGRYVFVPATPAETAAANFWGVVKLANLD